MNKRNLLKWCSIGFGTTLLASGTIGASVALVSCSNTTNPFGTKTYQSFNAKVETPKTFAASANTAGSTDTVEPVDPGFTVDLDPSTNANAQQQFKELLSKIATNAMQKEFDNGLLQFFQANEFELETGSTEVEADILSIKVNNVNWNKDDTSISNNPFGIVTVDATIKFEVEKEIGDDENKNFQEQEATITLIPQLAGKNELDDIAKQLKSFGTASNKENQEIMEELREIYFGDKDSDMDLDDLYDQDANKWENNGGVLNFLNNFIINKNPFAKMAGWNINLDEVKYTPDNGTTLKLVKKDITKSLWVPSSMYSTVFYPTLNGNGNGNTTTDINKVQNIDNDSDVNLKINFQDLNKQTMLNWFTTIFNNSNITDSTEIVKVMEKLAPFGISFTKVPTSIVIDSNEFATDKEVEIKFTVGNIIYEIDVQASWFKSINNL